MEGINENKYYIIEFVTPCNNEEYAIVPHSWIKSGKPTKGVVVVAYPKERPIITTHRVKRNEKCEENWKTYVATIKHDYSDFNAAKWKLNWIISLNKCDQTLMELTPKTDYNNSLDNNTRSKVMTMKRNSIINNNDDRVTQAQKRKISNDDIKSPSTSKIQKSDIKNNKNGSQNKTQIATVKNISFQETLPPSNAVHMKSSNSSNNSNQLQVQSRQQNITLVPTNRLLEMPNTRFTQETTLPSPSNHVISNTPTNYPRMQTEHLHSQHVPLDQNSIHNNSNLSNITNGDHRKMMVFNENIAELYQTTLNNTLQTDSLRSLSSPLSNPLPERQFQSQMPIFNTNQKSLLNENQSCNRYGLFQNKINHEIYPSQNSHNLQPATSSQLSAGNSSDRNQLQDNIEKRSPFVQNKFKQIPKPIIKGLLQQDKCTETRDLEVEFSLHDQHTSKPLFEEQSQAQFTRNDTACEINPINLQNDTQNNNRNGLLQKTTSIQSTTINTSSDVQNHPASTKKQNHYIKSCKSEQLSPTYTDYLHQELNLQECAPNLLTNNKRIDQKISKKIPSTVQNPSKAINNSVKYNSPLLQNRSDLDTHNEKTFNGIPTQKHCIMQSNSSKLTTENIAFSNDVSQSLTVPSKPNEKLISHRNPGNNISSLKMPATSTTPIDTTEKEKRRQENNGTLVKKSYNNADVGLRNDDNKDRCNLNNRQNSNRSLDFPPEYDSNDTRWTLKYSNFEVGVVELVPRSNVYISVVEYERCLRNANNCKSLAQMLLTSIFSDRALRVCSLFGGNTGTELDEHTKEVILKFVAVYGIKKEWLTYSSHTMTDILNNKIQDMRSKVERVNNEL